MKAPEVAEKVIDLANRVKEYWDKELPRHHPDYPWIKPGEQDVPPPPLEKELEEFLTGLPDNVIYELGLIMSLGKGDVEKQGLVKHLETIKRNFDGPKELAAYMAEKPALGSYLSEGLAELRRDRIDLTEVIKIALPKRGKKKA